jgi:hypothetical protein
VPGSVRRFLGLVAGAILLLPAAGAAQQPAGAQADTAQQPGAEPADTAQPTAAQPAAEPLPRAVEPGAELTVYHAVFGPGEAVWEKFGHNALWIHDAATGTTISYNYGMFDFAQPGFVPRLMRGDMLYSMGVRDADEELAVYTYYDRSVWIQRLNLTPAQSHALREFLEWNWLPANRDYRYDYFRDNCATRIRDAIDRVLDGAVRDALGGVATGTTFRSHSLRLTAESLPTYTGLLLGLGSPTDRPIDAWDEGFIPMELMRRLREVNVTDAAGRTVPLVAEERTLYISDRPPPPDAPPGRTAGYLLVGVLAGAGLSLLGRFARHSRRAAFGLAAAITVWGVVTGFFGLILTLLWGATSHIDTFDNLNLLQVNPVGFLIAVAAPLAVLRRTAPSRAFAVVRLAWPAAIAMLALSSTGLLIHLLSVLPQDNGPIIALVLPVHAAVVLSLYQAIPRNTSPAGDADARIRLPARA